MKRVLFVFPTAWDRKQLAACRERWRERYDVAFAEPSDEDCPSALDPAAWLDEAVRVWGGRVQGVTSSSDYPGATLAAALADRLGLPGPRPADVLRASHKYYSRIAQRRAVPDATPGFDLVPGALPLARDPSVGYPCFVKPVKGAFSVMSGRIGSRADLEAFLGRPWAREFLTDYVALFNRLLTLLSDLEIGGSHLLAEELLHGRQVTVEGWVADDEVHILGIVDSLLHPGIPSFSRFDYPSVRRADVQERMRSIARRVVRDLGLRHTLFNIEMIYEPTFDRIHIIEINPRLCGQFADLYQKVDGVSGYEVALAVATGEEPPEPGREPRSAMATSFPLRTYAPVRVKRGAARADVEAAEALFAGTLIWLECAEGDELSDFESEDGCSSRYAVVNLAGDTRADLTERLGRTTARLGLELEPL